ncbi:MAG: UDP-N-acetylglucosamine--N-acetylmuramyl-(pentapeptide) pyrophosphoryl-undecaprenol N-acetylglucosamine transferase [Thermoflexales bacterium]|nr:UDP-N-acetylglucosamine--N-acetylmuramyl-(pentapeptide) pyrophosphoryl-undecaprenol N-acetylglucosamine transferase [Thermoflexales bacterium]
MLEALQKIHSSVSALFVGEQEGMERELVTRTGTPFRSVRAGAMHGVGLAHMARSSLRLAAGLVQSLRLIEEVRPHVVFLTGGFVGVPVSVAAWVRRVPSVVFLPDIEPGLAVRLMARLATCVAATTPASAVFFDARRFVATGYPLRESFKKATRAEGRARFGIAERARVLLVYGGSRGARSINRALLRDLARLLAEEDVVVIHISGKTDWDEVRNARAQLPEAHRQRYLAFPYLHDEMPLAMAAADLVVCRSGASVLGELTYLGLPAVLVPYPHAWRYQQVNARYIADRGAATILPDEALSAPGVLANAVVALLRDDERLTAMRRAARALAVDDGAERLARLLIEAAQARACGAEGI